MTTKITLDFVRDGVRHTEVKACDRHNDLLAVATFTDGKLGMADAANKEDELEFVRLAAALVNPPTESRLFLFTETNAGHALILPVVSLEDAQEAVKRVARVEQVIIERALLLDLGSEVKLVA